MSRPKVSVDADASFEDVAAEVTAAVDSQPDPGQPDEPEGGWPSAEERKGMRAHDEDGNVRPADGRWALHRPEDESEATTTTEDQA